MTSELKINNLTAKRNSTFSKPQQNGVVVVSFQDNNSLPRTETTKVRRVSVANNRVIVKHLRKRLESVREQRSAAQNDIAEKEGERVNKEKLTSRAEKHTKKNMFSTPDSTRKVSTSSSNHKMNGYIHTNGYNIKALEYFFSGDSTLPSIIVDEHDASVMTESDQCSTDSRRAETPGIFVDWESETESPKVQNEMLFDDEFSDASRVLTHHMQMQNENKNYENRFSHVDKACFVQKRKLKIFVSGDNTVLRERELLMTKIFPRLSNLARSNGLLLEVVDLNETPDGTEMNALRKTHIDNAVKHSVGTAFVTFLSNATNEDIAIPVKIPENIMNKIFALISLEILVHDAKAYHILREARQNNNAVYESHLEAVKKVRFSDETSVQVALEEILYGENDRIHKCYKIRELFLQEYELDENAVPPIYVLKENQRTKETDENLMENIQKYLRRLLDNSTVKKWTEEIFKPHVLKDISTAVDLSSDPKTNCLCFHRLEHADWNHMGSHKQSEDIKTKVSSKIGYNNMREYKMTRNEITKFNQGKPATLAGSSTAYLEKLEFDVYNTISLQTHRMTEAAINEAQARDPSEDIVHEHTRFLQENCEYFTGMESTLEEIRKYIVSEYEKVPLAVCGEPGCGLSSILSVAASRTEEWIKHRSCLPDIRYRRQNRKTISIFRSVGLTAETLSTKHLLFGICKQLQNILNKSSRIENRLKGSASPEIILGSAQQMAFLLTNTLMSLVEKKYLIVIFIDNLNAALEDKGKYSLSWIPKPLLKYVKVVLSFSSNAKPIYCPRENDVQPENMQEAYFSQYKMKSKILQVPALSNCETLATRYVGKPTNARSILAKQLLKCKRTLTPMQKALLLQAVNLSLNPLSLKVLVEIAKTWRSGMPISECHNITKNWGRNTDNFCRQYLSVIRRRHNRVLFRSVVGFLTCSKSGLTHQEIVDLTSRDKRVSREFLTSMETGAPQSSDNRCLISFVANSKLYELIEDLREFLVETLSDDVPTIKWRHAVFESQVYAMFMETVEDWKYYHRIMLSYFSNKSYVCSCGKTHEGCQPLQWNSCSRTFLNTRRVNESLFHAIQCDNIDVIKKEMLFDIEWLQTKLEATSIESLSDELYQVLKLKPDDNDVKLLTEALYLSHDVLSHDSQQLSSQLLGRLNDVIAKDIPLAPEDPRKYPHTRILLSQIRRRHFSFLMPSKTCLTSGKQVIYDALHGHEGVITAIASCTDGQRIITASKDSTIKIWDVIERRVLRTIGNVGRDVSSMCVCMGNYYVATIHKQNQVNVWSLLKCEKVLTVKDYVADEQISLTVASEGQLLAIVSNTSASIRVWDLDKLIFHREVDVSSERTKNVNLSVARSSRGNNAFIGYKGHSEAVVVNIKRGKIARTLTCESGRITQVETSREYYIVGCRQRRMEMHELHYFYLFDSINYGLIRILKSCADDAVYDFFVNRLGSHLIGLCVSPHGDEELVVWSTEGQAHRHMIQSKKRYLGGTCTDLQYCMTACETESVVRIHNLAAQISKHDHSRTQVRKKVDGIGRLFNMPHHEKYVVAQGTSGSPITIWNVARSRCRGEAVIIERGLLDKNDIVVVKDVLVVILSDRGMVTMNERSQQVFETIYVYNLLLRKYERKLHPVRINMCPPDHYHIIGNDQLIATSIDRISLVVWSIVTGEVLYQIHSNFPTYQIEKNTRTKRKKNRHIGPFPERKPANTKELPKTTWKKGRVTDEDRLRTIFEMVVSADDTTLVCSYYSRHLAVFDLDSKSHRHTLSDRHSLLQLHKAIITRDGSFLLSTNYDDAAHCSYVTLWDLKEGSVARRRRDEPKVCSLAMTKDASRIVFVTEDNFIKIWDPFRRRSHRSIAGYRRLDLSSLEGDDAQATTIFITDDGQRAILYANSLSVWDLDAEKLLMVFEPDVKFQCCTVALDGQVIVVGMRDSPDITTLRVPPLEGKTALHEEDRFGEGSESSDDSSGDEK